jgi:hypothetical protein
MPIQHDPTCAVDLLDRKGAREVVRIDTHTRRADRRGRHPLSSGIQRSQDFPHIPTRVLHRRLDGLEPIAFASGVTIRVHNEKRHGNSHSFGLKQRQYLILRVEVPGEAKDGNFLTSVSNTFDKISVGFRARPWPDIRYTGPG